MNGYVKKLEFDKEVKMGNNSMRWGNKIFMEKNMWNKKGFDRRNNVWF